MYFLSSCPTSLIPSGHAFKMSKTCKNHILFPSWLPAPQVAGREEGYGKGGKDKERFPGYPSLICDVQAEIGTGGKKKIVISNLLFYLQHCVIYLKKNNLESPKL